MQMFSTLMFYLWRFIHLKSSIFIMNQFKEGDLVIAPSKYSKITQKGQILSIRNGLFAYIRFFELNKRLDEWIPLSMLVLADRNKEKYDSFPKTKINIDLNNGLSNRNIDTIRIHNYEIDCWYYSPYPINLTKTRHLYICEFCLMYFTSPDLYRKHCHTLRDSRPSGYEIYRKDNISIFEIESQNDRLYCQSLYLLSKLFIEKSSLNYNVDNTTFYTLCLYDKTGAHFVGAFARPTNWMGNIIVSEIFVLPPYQKQGYSQIMLSCAYELAHRAYVIGGPERPLNDLGSLAFQKYFRIALIQLFISLKSSVYTVHDISLRTSICENDVINTLENMKILDENTAHEIHEIPLTRIYAYLNSLLKDSNNKDSQYAITSIFDKQCLLWFTCQSQYPEEEEYSYFYSFSEYEESDNESESDSHNYSLPETPPKSPSSNYSQSE